MTLGQRIQELRKAAGLSQEALGEALGVSRQAVSKWEGDNGIPELDTLIAMSRLFGVTVGQLLGVEEAAPAQADAPEAEAAPTMDEERVEAILSRYVEESRRYEPERKPTILSWMLAAVVLVAAFAIAAVSIGRVREVRNDINDLWDNVSQIESIVTNVRNQMGGLSENIRDQVSSALEMQIDFISDFSHELTAVDIENQTVTLRFDATLREYTARSTLQVLVNWTKTDETTGQTASEFVPGPDFTAEITIPMCYTAQVVVRVADDSGAIREQKIDETLYYHPESFRLKAYNLLQPFSFTVSRWGSTTVSVDGSSANLDILSQHPEVYWPVQAELTAWVNEKQVYFGTLKLTQPERGSEYFFAAPAGGYCEIRMTEGDTFRVMARVTDNFGRTLEFWDNAAVKNGKLEKTPMSAPVVAVPD